MYKLVFFYSKDYTISPSILQLTIEAECSDYRQYIISPITVEDVLFQVFGQYENNLLHTLVLSYWKEIFKDANISDKICIPKRFLCTV